MGLSNHRSNNHHNHHNHHHSNNHRSNSHHSNSHHNNFRSTSSSTTLLAKSKPTPTIWTTYHQPCAPLEQHQLNEPSLQQHQLIPWRRCVPSPPSSSTTPTTPSATSKSITWLVLHTSRVPAVKTCALSFAPYNLKSSWWNCAPSAAACCSHPRATSNHAH